VILLPDKEGKQKMEPQLLTNDEVQLALSQLEYLRTVERAKVAQYLHEAKESGDVIDNAAYDDAKNDQARLEGRILELEQMLATAKLVDKVRTDVVSLGSLVHLSTNDDREYRYTIVGVLGANPSGGSISYQSPVGKALLGHKVGELVIVSAPGGVKEYTILSIA
jgi:transcription elongation factor GreA